MDVIPTLLTLLNGADIASFTLKNRVAFTLSNQLTQIVEYSLHPQSRLSLRTVIQVDPDHTCTGVAIKHGIYVTTNLDLLLNGQVALIMLPTLESLLGKESTDTLGQLIQCLAGTQIASFIFA
ncbi:hypothetical protein GT37_01635 [Pseudomonas putida]|nr:hypothetical protein GT37_01635 [Pseudomonas putida]